MKAFHIVDRTIALRDHQGDLFQFALVPHQTRPTIRLVAPPIWKGGSMPLDAAARIDVATMSALDIARRSGLLG